MMQLKTTKYLDTYLNNLLENSFFFCKPPAQSLLGKIDERPIWQKYIRYCEKK